MPSRYTLHPRYIAALLLVYCLVIVVGCQSAGTDNSSLPNSEPVTHSSLPTSDAVKYSLVLKAPNEPLSSDVQKFLNTFSGFLDSLNSGSMEDLAKYLHDDFQVSVVYQDATLTSYSKEMLLDLENHHDLKFLFFKKIVYTPLKFNILNTGEVLLALHGQKTSSHFNSIQTVFVRYSNDLSKIISLTIQPIPPAKITTSPEIYLTRIRSRDEEYGQNWRHLVGRMNPDGAVEYVRSRDVPGVKSDGSDHSVLVVFPEPLPIGADVRIQHQFFLIREKKWLGAYEFHYKINEPGEYQVIETMTRVGSTPGQTITFRVFVNGNKVAERTVPVI